MCISYLFGFRAAGFESRYVLDLTDHVWTEIFSVKQQCWLHCDPCEAVCDRPLIYEAGWGKKLSYIFAFSKDDIQDVTWRYSAKHAELLNRRNVISENLLVRQILRMRERRQKNLNQQYKQTLLLRTANELTSFFALRKAGEDESGQGRTSGSLEWRLSRGETNNKNDSYVFTPTAGECKLLCMEIWYNCASDHYLRVSDGRKSTSDWSSCAHKSDGVFRKEEPDWKMAYIARKEGTQHASIEWKWDVTGMHMFNAILF